MAPDGDAAVPERCPDCDGPMVSYTLDGADAGVCERCGHVGIDADHTADPPARESWSEALSRFYAEFGTGSDDAGSGGADGSAGSGDADGDSDGANDESGGGDAGETDAGDESDADDTDDAGADGADGRGG
jgi:hypothetical protein